MTVYVRGAGAAEVPGALLRTNYAPDPLPSKVGAHGNGWTVTNGTGASSTLAQVAGVSRPDDRPGLLRFTQTVKGTGGETTVAVHIPGPLAEKPPATNPYRLSFWVRPTGSLSVQLVAYVGGEGMFFPYVLPGSTQLLPAGVWTRVSWDTRTTPGQVAGSTNLGLGVRFAGTAPAGLIVDFARVLLEATTELRPWFDGIGPAGPNERATWDGTANASLSRLRELAYSGELEVPLLLEYSSEVNTRHRFLDVIGRASPLPILGTPQLRSGRLELFTLNHAAALAVQKMHDGLVTVRDTEYPDLGMTYGVTRSTIAPEPEQVRVRPWRVTADFQEVTGP